MKTSVRPVASMLLVLGLVACGGRVPDTSAPVAQVVAPQTPAVASAAGPAVSAPAAATEHPAPAPLPVPEDVQVRSAVAYVSGPTADPERHLLDLYLPKEPRGFPTVVFVHGGGYQRGDRSVGHNLGVVLAHHGVAVASISYRLFPQVMHPGHITDVARAVAWVKSHIAESGGDPNRVFISGHSAGAHLAALLATDGSYLAGVGLKPADLAGVLSISGGYRINPIRKPVFGDDAALAAASPFAHLTGGHPPFLLIYGGLEKPDRADVSRELRDGLRAQGAWATCVVIPDRDHQGLLDHVAEGDPTSDLLLKTIAQLSQTPLPKPLD